MEIKTVYFLAAFGIGLAVELLLQNNPTIYDKTIYISKAIIIAGVIALMPSSIIRLVFFGFILAKAGDLAGGVVLRGIKWLKVKAEARKWDTNRNRKDTSQDNS